MTLYKDVHSIPPEDRVSENNLTYPQSKSAKTLGGQLWGYGLALNNDKLVDECI